MRGQRAQDQGVRAVTDLKLLRPVEPNPELIEYLQTQLADAESGHIQGVIGLVLLEDGTCADFWRNPAKAYQTNIVSDRVVGCLERIKFQMLSHRFGLECAEEPDDGA